MQEVSLYIPCFNAGRFIDQCLDGVLKQTRPPDEIIVVDDGSTDQTVEIASSYPVSVVRHGQNKGLGAARNTGIRSARHGLVASLDADCVPRPGWLAALANRLTRDDIAGAGGKLIERNCVKLPDRWRSWHMRQHWGDESIANPLFLFGNNNLFRKAAIEEAGLYNERLRTNFEDVSMSEALSRRGYTLVYEPAAVVEHLRTDTLQSVIKANWKWRFFGYRNDVTLKNVIEHARKVGARELRSFLGVDYNRSDILSGLLSCIAVAYALFSDLYYYTQHRGESRIHDS